MLMQSVLHNYLVNSLLSYLEPHSDYIPPTEPLTWDILSMTPACHHQTDRFD